MGHLSYEASIKAVYRGLILLAFVTLLEVFISLLAKGHVIKGLHELTWVIYLGGLLIIGLSLYKAYFIVYDFMHMRYEVKGLAMSVLLPTLLLVWALIAFFQEGDSWKDRRNQIRDKNEEEVESKVKGGLSLSDDVYVLPEWKG